MQAITARDVERMQERGEDFVLINVLPEESFRERHIPGSTNIPVGRENFIEEVEQLAGAKSRPIVVYCANTECSASPTAAQKLEQAGFTEVYDFVGGMQEWEQTNHEVESGAA